MSHITESSASDLGRRGGLSKKVAAIERRIYDLMENDPPPTEEQLQRLVHALIRD